MVSIRIRNTLKNYENFIFCLCYFDMMVSGAGLDGDIKRKHISVMTGLIKNILGEETMAKFDDYILETFKCFLVSKEQMVVDLEQLYQFGKKEMVNLIMNEIEKGEKVRNSTDNKNLIKKQIFDVFKNIKKMVIISTSRWLLKRWLSSFSFSLSGFLGIIEKTSLEKVIVKAVVRTWKNDSWLSLLWKSSSSEIEKQYEQKNYNIGYKRGDGKRTGWKEDWLEIVGK